MEALPFVKCRKGITAMRIVAGLLSMIAVCELSFAQSPAPATTLTDPSAHLSDFQAIEFRRYTSKEGERKHFAQYFESYFPEAMEQTGAIAAGSFFERKNQTVSPGFEDFTRSRLVL
jgi:hypothetical protein